MLRYLRLESFKGVWEYIKDNLWSLKNKAEIQFQSERVPTSQFA